MRVVKPSSVPINTCQTWLMVLVPWKSGFWRIISPRMQPRLHISMPLVYLQRENRCKWSLLYAANSTLYSLSAGHQNFGCPVPTCRHIIREQRFVLDLILTIFRIASLGAKSASQAKVGYFESAKENELKTNIFNFTLTSLWTRNHCGRCDNFFLISLK